MIGPFWFSNWKHIYNCYIFIHIYAYLFCIVLVFRDRILLTSLIWPGTPYVCCCGFKLVILLHQPPKSKECRLVPSGLGFILEIFKKMRIIPALSLGNVWQLLWLGEPLQCLQKSDWTIHGKIHGSSDRHRLWLDRQTQGLAWFPWETLAEEVKGHLHSRIYDSSWNLLIKKCHTKWNIFQSQIYFKLQVLSNKMKSTFRYG